MKAFVTGATGFIGSHIVDRLLEDPDVGEVRCLVRNSEKWLLEKQYTKIQGDLEDIDALSRGIFGVDVVIHVAGVVKAQTQAAFTRANVDATENILRVCQKHGIENIIIMSSLAAAGPSNGTPLSEEQPMKPISMYGVSKMEMEQMIHSVATKNQSIKIVRPPAVYGPREDQIYTFFKSVSKRICPIIGNGKHPLVSMVYVDDLVNGILLLSKLNQKGVHTFYLSGQKDYQWNEIKQNCDIVFGRTSLPLRLKPGLVKKIGAFAESAGSLFGIYPVINREKASEMVHEWTCSHKKSSNFG